MFLLSESQKILIKQLGYEPSRILYIRGPEVEFTAPLYVTTRVSCSGAEHRLTRIVYSMGRNSTRHISYSSCFTWVWLVKNISKRPDATP